MIGDYSLRREEEQRVAQEGRLPPGQSLTNKFPVLHYGPVPPFDPATWDLRIWGEVEDEVRWTWDEFLAAARKLTQDQDGDGRIEQYGVGIKPSIFRLAPFIWQNNGELVDHGENPTRLALDSPEAREAFEWFINLQNVEHVVPNGLEESAESSESRFLNGKLGMYFNSRRGVPSYRTIKSFQWDVAPLPQNILPAGILHSDAYCMSAKVENKEAAWAFIEFANSVAGQEIVAQSGRTVPSLKYVAESETFLSPDSPPANSRVWLDTVATIRMVPIMASWVGIEQQVGAEIEKAFYGEIDLDEAIDTAIKVAQPYFDEAP